MFYLAVKHLHIVCVGLSILGFCWRGYLRLTNSALARRRWVRIVPHLNDSLLLAAALTMAGMSGQYPFIAPWLTAKFFGLLAYIILGALALGEGRPGRVRVLAGVLAIIVYGWMVTVAVTKTPLGIFALQA